MKEAKDQVVIIVIQIAIQITVKTIVKIVIILNQALKLKTKRNNKNHIIHILQRRLLI